MFTLAFRRSQPFMFVVCMASIINGVRDGTYGPIENRVEWCILMHAHEVMVQQHMQFIFKPVLPQLVMRSFVHYSVVHFLIKLKICD